MSANSNGDNYEVRKTEDEWRQTLSPDAFRVLRKHGTEPAFRNEYNEHDEEGVYHCAGCGSPVFGSEAKYHSGSGWPSFYAPVDEEKVGKKTDYKLLMPRTEVHCSRCGGHLGHVFEDGPEPTGLRYCINSAALRFRKGDGDSDEPSPPS